MVAIRSFFILSAAAGIASAGKCKPESRSSSIVPVASSTGSASVSVIESSTTLADTTTETSLSESATETASSATSSDVSTTESKLTTFLTSFTTSNADTTTEAATTTSAASGPVVSCPSDVDQCLGTMEIQCGVLLGGLNNPRILADMNDCAQQCNSDTSCRAFTYNEYMHECFIITTQEIAPVNIGGWVAGIKGTCGESTEPSSTVFTSTAETTTTEAATTTTAAAPPVGYCGTCVGLEQIQCDFSLKGGSFIATGTSIVQCASLCQSNDACNGFSRRRDDGWCLLTFADDVVSTENEGWDSGVVNSCAT